MSALRKPDYSASLYILYFHYGLLRKFKVRKHPESTSRQDRTEAENYSKWKNRSYKKTEKSWLSN